MTWIKTVPFEEADERLRHAMEAQRGLYPAEYAEPVHPTPDGESSGIVASHSLIPDALYHAFATFGALMSPELPLTRAQHEMIATVVSAFFSFGGWWDLSKLGGEVRDPARTLPRAYAYGLLVVVAVYVLTSAACIQIARAGVS